METIVNQFKNYNWKIIKKYIKTNTIDWNYIIDQINASLHYLAYHNQNKLIKVIPKNIILEIIKQPNLEGDTVIHIAAKLKNFRLLKYLFTIDINIIYSPNLLGYRALYYIIDNIEIIKYVLTNYHISDHLINYNHSLIDYYILNNNTEMILLLLNYLELNDHTNKSIFTIIQSKFNSDTKINLLNNFINFGININQINNNYISTLSICVQQNNYHLVKYLLEHDAKVNYSGADNNYNPLIMSILSGNSSIVKLLLYHGASINIRDKNFKSACHHIIYNNTSFSKKLIKFFVINTKNINFPDKHGNTVLNLIFQLDNWKLFMDILSTKKMDIYLPNKMKIRPIDNVHQSDFELFINMVYKSYLFQLTYNNNWTDSIDNTISQNLKISNNKNEYQKIIIDKIINGQSYPIKHKTRNLIKLIITPNVNITHFTAYTYNYICYLSFLLKKYIQLCIPFGSHLKNKLKQEVKNYNKNISTILNDYINHSPILINHIIIWQDPNNYFISPDLIMGIKRAIKSNNYKFIIIKLTLINPRFNHANILILDIKKNNLERFDPYGNVPYFKSEDIDNFINNKILINLPNIKYLSPKKITRTISFQIYSDEANEFNYVEKDPMGFCMAWCMWYVETRINNENIKPNKLIKQMEYLINKYNYKFKDYIRNYSNYLDIEKNNILSDGGIPKQYWYTKTIPQSIYKRYLEYINKLYIQYS
ncbi:ankyrin repeat protein [Megavirus baoshan]|uniref:Putative ankyrin repeat protein n=1 Tax=Megavirus baoshan TaxID=2496520 RepID=A0A3S8UWS9_9VIRU|nr:ankyrin repeat protein [Megavirus baoshan]AZL89270.1 ankyrin repeat protein [Megavirus baoshan]